MTVQIQLLWSKLNNRFYNHETQLWVIFMTFPNANRLFSPLEVTLGRVTLMVIGLSLGIGSRMERPTREESRGDAVHRTCGHSSHENVSMINQMVKQV